MSRRTVLLEGAGNTLVGPFYLQGPHALAINGVFGGATLNIFHRLPVGDQTGDQTTDANNLPQNPDLSFTSAPVPMIVDCPQDLPMFARVTGGSGSTSLNCSFYELD